MAATSSQANLSAREHRKAKDLPGANPHSTAAFGLLNVADGEMAAYCSADGLVGVPTNTPSAANDTGVAGTITWDASYIYVCTATDTWKRVAIATWP